ncbi:MAG: MBOAT family protein, partial [Clostridia bacterium]|nr:MBOAT family protein [Clostridia bacterium]
MVVVLYYIVPKRFQWCLLLLASYAFYLFSGIKQVVFILATTAITYFAGIIMQKMRDEHRSKVASLGDTISKEEKRSMKKEVSARIHKVQVAAVLLDLGILIVVKYLNFLIGNVNSIFSLFAYDAKLPLLNIIVPLGISFYTFMSMGYLIDVGRGKYDAEKNFGKLALFVSFFPSIVQGPISRFDEVGKQLTAEHKFDYNKFTYGAQLILWGFFKKMVIADRVAPIVADIFSANYASYSGTELFIGMLAYAAQIYCDFAGGIDIARGAAEMMGIRLPRNFERPYFSQSVAEYWRRWHITLGAWMREYVFYPIMLSKPVTKLSKFAREHWGNYAARMVPSVITPFIVFFLIGIWHGASWQNIAFGLYNATIVAGSVALDPLFKKGLAALHINSESFAWRVFRIVRTFLILGVSKILVKAPGLGAAIKIIGKIVTD